MVNFHLSGERLTAVSTNVTACLLEPLFLSLNTSGGLLRLQLFQVTKAFCKRKLILFYQKSDISLFIRRGILRFQAGLDCLHNQFCQLPCLTVKRPS